jgi:hypothetical protein
MRGRLGRRFATVLAAGLTAVVLGMTLAGTASAATRGPDPVPIEPNQTFSGYVNNSPPGNATIKVVCPGVANTGHPIGKQPVEVQPVPSSTTQDNGFTGSKGKMITARLAYGPAIVTLDSFTSYYVPKFIPTKITVPCSGTGTVIFAPSPGSKTAKSAILTVTFVNIGA